jgi:hypothetical protein
MLDSSEFQGTDQEHLGNKTGGRKGERGGGETHAARTADTQLETLRQFHKRQKSNLNVESEVCFYKTSTHKNYF